MPNPDNRSDNAEKLQEMVQNTIDNFNEAKETANFLMKKTVLLLKQKIKDV